MTQFWAFVAWLISLLAPTAGNDEAARCAGAVTAAYASMARATPSPEPEPKPGCCDECRGTGWIVHGDGHKTPCPCPQSCQCKQRGQHTPTAEKIQ